MKKLALILLCLSLHYCTAKADESDMPVNPVDSISGPSDKLTHDENYSIHQNEALQEYRPDVDQSEDDQNTDESDGDGSDGSSTPY